ncbi:hypothetical protein DL767_007903 [Monosporascus sp. MG133]|nr:hypothetical protein DL767_007903 [Monosporascus sp. MG133]
MDLKRLLWGRLPPNTLFPPGTDFDPVFRPWGITIYRTAYGDTPDSSAESDGNWQALLDDIQTPLRDELLKRGDPSKGGQDDETVYAARKLLSLFRLDARSDPQVLSNADMDQLREIYNAGAAGGEPMNAHGELRQCRIFLVADEETLASIAQAQQGGQQPAEEEQCEKVFVKCVDADYRPEDHGPPPWRTRVRAPQTYFGWMKMATRSLLRLWACLGDGGHLVDVTPRASDAMTAKEIWTGEDED